MPKYQRTYECTNHYLHEVEADSLEEAIRLFEADESVCIDTQKTWFTTDIDEMEG